jgi:2,5-diamino-6-(ribosylamino)-4(3H)-pyrimidinone 5'-phosphate reductase
MAMTADGKIASANRAVSSFGSKADREHLLELRAQADAVMAGARTVDLNPVNLGPGPERFRKLRLRNGLAEYNLRVIVSGSGSIDPKAKIFRRRFSPIIILASSQIPKRRLRLLETLADEVRICGEKEIDFPAALRWLKSKWNVERLLCEGGGEVNGALFQVGLVDELHLTLCPKILGGRNAPTIAEGENPARLTAAQPMRMISSRRVGDESFLVYRRGWS